MSVGQSILSALGGGIDDLEHGEGLTTNHFRTMRGSAALPHHEVCNAVSAYMDGDLLEPTKASTLS